MALKVVGEHPIYGIRTKKVVKPSLDEGEQSRPGDELAIEVTTLYRPGITARDHLAIREPVPSSSGIPGEEDLVAPAIIDAEEVQLHAALSGASVGALRNMDEKLGAIPAAAA